MVTILPESLYKSLQVLCPLGYRGVYMLDEFLLRTFCYQNPRTNRGLLLNRIDVHIKFPYPDYEKLSGDRVGMSSESVCVCVQAA